MTGRISAAARLVKLAVAALLLSACASSTGPEEPAEEAPQIHNVTIAFEELDVLGTCDYNSIFEDREDGEFLYGVNVGTAAVSDVEFTKSALETLPVGPHPLVGWRVVVRRDVSKRVGVGIQFTASERDGLAGNDPTMNYKTRLVAHQWNGTRWDGDGEIVLGDQVECTVILYYTITSTPIP